jgi:hypothetical protein
MDSAPAPDDYDEFVGKGEEYIKSRNLTRILLTISAS